jgi:beta-glucosidase
MYKKLTAIAMASAMTLSALGQPAPAIPQDPDMEQRIEKILQKMTLEEKIGQMTEITIDVVTDFNSPNDFKLDPAKLQNVIGKYKVGSLLNVPLSIAQKREKWAEAIKQIQDLSMKEIGIPCIYGVDQIHGTTYTLDGTLFPQGINMGATFNPGLMEQEAEISAYETRASCIPWTYAPVMDLGRDPRWPRIWESFGEDPLVNSTMATAAVRGFQGKDPNHVDLFHVATSIKHFMAYGVPVSGKDRTPSMVSTRELRERYFQPFLDCIRQGALTLMVNSGVNDGVPFHANKELLTNWIKRDLNWDGLIVTDWADINNLCTRDHIAATKKEAIKIAINAGIDMSMVPYELSFCDDLKELVQEGEVPMSRIDDAVRRVLRLKFRLGLFDNPYWNIKKYKEFGSKAHADVALECAQQSIVLLKNENNILPLSKGKRILLTGPNANSMRCLNGGWSYTWQGDKADQCAGAYNTILEAMQNKFGKENIVYEPGVTYSTAKDAKYFDENAPEIDKAVKAAENVDVIVACVGENSYCETPGNLDDLNLSANQKALVKALTQTGKPVVLVLNEGRPRIINDIVDGTKAVVDIMLPGNYGGDALANLLSGDANFSGKLPITYPRFINSLATYDYKPCENIGQMNGNYNYDAVMNQQWNFGDGLSYTTFRYSNLRADKTAFGADDQLTFSVDVTNTGSREGMESVLLFSSDNVASITPDNKRLRAFTKLTLKPGETKTATLTIKASDLAFVGADNKWILEPGDFTIRCGKEKITVTCQNGKKWQTPNR